MAVARLSLTNFRSYADVLIEPGPGFVVLTGDNGAGKTNILEAISLLAPGRGLRGATLGEMARHEGGGGFGISARVADADLGTGTVATVPERRIVRINGATVPTSALGERLSLVWLTPAHDRLFVDTPGDRRRFLDRLVLALDPAHAHDSARYEAAMRQRNRLLADDRPDAEWLTLLEGAMATHGQALATRRLGVVEALGERIAAAVKGPFARAGLTLSGFDCGDDFTGALRGSRARDAAAGRTLVGPHRHDLIVSHLDKAVPAAQASTGEQKALIIGIVLAHAELVALRQSRRPILLLDEVAAHLDPHRREALFARLADSGGQVWMTGTEPSAFLAIDRADHFIVANGAVGRSA